jgi:hypothetical protein
MLKLLQFTQALGGQMDHGVLVVKPHGNIVPANDSHVQQEPQATGCTMALFSRILAGPDPVSVRLSAIVSRSPHISLL